MWPALRTLAKTTLPKLPSPISLRTSNLSSKATALIMGVDDPRWVKSCATVMVKGGVVSVVGLLPVCTKATGLPRPAGYTQTSSGRATHNYLGIREAREAEKATVAIDCGLGFVRSVGAELLGTIEVGWDASARRCRSTRTDD